MTMTPSYRLMDAEEVHAALDDMADRIVTGNAGRPIVLVGIHRRGIPMAQRMAKRIAHTSGAAPEMGILDINLYRDDLTRVAFQPVVRRTDVPPNIDDKDVILIDRKSTCLNSSHRT